MSNSQQALLESINTPRRPTSVPPLPEGPDPKADELNRLLVEKGVASFPGAPGRALDYRPMLKELRRAHAPFHAVKHGFPQTCHTRGKSL